MEPPAIERDHPGDDEEGGREPRRIRVPDRLAGWRWFVTMSSIGIVLGGVLGLAGSLTLWSGHRGAREVPTLTDDHVASVDEDPPHATAGLVHGHLNAVIWGGASLDDDAPTMLRALADHVDDAAFTEDLRQAAGAIEQRHLHAAHSLVMHLEERLP